MFTQKTLKALKIFLSLHHFARCGPYVWGKGSSCRIEFHSTKIEWVLLLMMPIWFSCRVVVTCNNFYNGIANQGTLKSSIGNFLQIQWHFVVVCYAIAMFRKMGEIKGFLNSLLNFNRDVAVSITGQAHPVKKDGCEKFLKTAIWLSIISPLLLVFSLYRKDPFNPRFLYRFVVSGTSRTCFFYIYGIIELYSQLYLWYPWFLVCTLMWLYCKSTIYWLKQMRFGANDKLSEHPKSVIKLFERLQILNIQFNDCLAELGMPALVIHTMTGHVALICITVKLHDAYPPAIYSLVVFWTLLWFYLEGIVYTMLGSVNHYSRGFLKSWTDVLGAKSRKS